MPPVLRTYGWLAGAIRARPCRWPVRLVAIDGKAGAGKSTFARHLSEALGGAPILPVDDFLAWDDLVEFWPRLEREVFAPLFAGRDVKYQARDWHNDTFGRGLGPWRELPFAPIVIFEGIGSSRRA